jgi:hypothetical protein
MDKMKSGEIRKLPAASSPMFVSQWAYQGTAKTPYIVSRKQGYKGNGYATEQERAQEWQCSCKSSVPRVTCKHIIAIKLKEKILVDVTPTEWIPKKKYPLIMVKSEKDSVVISKEEHDAYKKFLAARGTRKAGNQFDEEGRKFRV